MFPSRDMGKSNAVSSAPDEGAEHPLMVDEALSSVSSIRSRPGGREKPSEPEASGMCLPRDSPRSSRWLDGQSGALGLELQGSTNLPADDPTGNWDKSPTTSDISRTPSQSTTGTLKSNNSLETAASSLQSGACSTEKKRDLAVEHHEPISMPTLSPGQYVTACSSPDEISSERRETDALRRYHALHELIETERGYAEDLDVLVKIFFPTLTTQAFFEENPARVATVSRNAQKLSELHAGLTEAWEAVMKEHHLALDDEGSLVDKAFRCGEAVQQVAEHLRQIASQFKHYNFFCSRHAQALVMIREAERRHGGDDFAAYERLCGNLIRTRYNIPTPKQPSSRRSSGVNTPVPLTTTAPLSPLDSPLTPPSAPLSGSTTPSSSFTSLSRSSTGRLLFADYLIKPIQRLCLYPLVLNSLLKYTPPQETHTVTVIQKAIEAMRRVADEVDEASRVHEKDLMAELTLMRIEPHSNVSHAFFKSLGPPQLSGTLDVLHHHSVETPLSAPLRFQHLGVIMWSDFVLFVRTRKHRQLECKYWFPLLDSTVTPNIERRTAADEVADEHLLATMKVAGQPFLPYAFRLSYKGHHFELSPSNEREHKIWYDSLRLAAKQASALAAPAQPLACSLSPKAGILDGGEALSEFITATVKPPTSNSLDGVIKMPSSTTRISVDRSMIFSDALIAPIGVAGVSTTMIGGTSSVRNISEALIAEQLRQPSTPSIGSAVGAAMGLAKMAATQMPTVKRVRKMSSLTMLDFSAIRSSTRSPVSEEGTIVADSNATPKRSSLSTLRANNTSSDALASGDPSSHRLSSPVESISSRVKGSLVRANSRLGRGASKSASGSLPASPSSSTLDLTQPISSADNEPGKERDSIRPNHLRSKSSSLRDIWSTTAGRRARSQSAQPSFTIPPYEGMVLGRYLSSQELSSSPPSSSADHSSPLTERTPLESPTWLRMPSCDEDSPLEFHQTRNSASAPTSQASSRRQSVASIFSLANTDLPRSSVPLRSSSPALSMSQMREGAAATLKRAKSAARYRLSIHSGMLASPAAQAAKPLASDASALGCIGPASADTTADSSATREDDEGQGRLVSSAEPQSNRGEGVVTRLRGSLGRTATSPVRSSPPNVQPSTPAGSAAPGVDVHLGYGSTIGRLSSPKSSVGDSRLLHVVEEAAASAEGTFGNIAQ